MGADQLDIQTLLSRPASQRKLEFKYRCAQAIVFGLPVVGLQYLGPRLGGPEAIRWIAILQALLAGWVTYVGATGILAEYIIQLRKALLPDFLVAMVGIALYLFSAISALGVFIRGIPFYQPLLFHWGVVVLAAWCGMRWQMLSQNDGSKPGPRL